MVTEIKPALVVIAASAAHASPPQVEPDGVTKVIDVAAAG
jgi:hypothetical protein